MEILYSTNTGSSDIGWRIPAPGTQNGNVPISFPGSRIASIPGQRYLYITGTKFENELPHAYLAVLDTCDNSITTEVDLGVGFGGQCAIPKEPGSNMAYVAISQAVADINPGPLDGGNRIAVLNIRNPALPDNMTYPPFTITGSSSDWGFLHCVWSSRHRTVYASHRGESNIYLFQQGLPPTFFATDGGEPVGLGISIDGDTLFVARRRTGDLLAFDVNSRNPTLRYPAVALQAPSVSNMFITVDSQNRVFVTSNRPTDGIVYIHYADLRGPSAQPIGQIDTGGTLLGQPAISPDLSALYVPRGSNNDIVQLGLQGTMATAIASSGNQPTDIVVLEHEAFITLSPEPMTISPQCGMPTQVRITAIDSCGQEVNVSVRATTSLSVGIMPQTDLMTPATFTFTCHEGGQGVINFTTRNFPFTTISIPVVCNCATNTCINFSAFAGGPLPFTPGDLDIFQVSGFQLSPVGFNPQGPLIAGNNLRLLSGGVLFTVHRTVGSIYDLTLNFTRQDPFSPGEIVIVNHDQGTTTIPSTHGLSRGSFPIVCPFTGITSWVVFGGAETLLTEICYYR